MKLKRLTQVVLLSFTMSTFVVGCSDENENNNPTTTTEAEVTTQEQTTTKEVEITTEEPTTTGYVYKGEKFIVDSKYKEHFMNLTVEKGYKFYLNHIVGNDEGTDEKRGSIGYRIAAALFFKKHVDKLEEFDYSYCVGGSNEYIITYDQNVVIEYNEKEKMYFHLVKEVDNLVAFDVYEIE